ncbi:MAG: hypothetical protein JNL79_35510 [Myxococcales bacterium]|nr:hypothetical protein [Myxococcales bacterium]
MEPAAARTDDDAVPTAELFVSLAPDEEPDEVEVPAAEPSRRSRALWLVLAALAIVPAVIVLARLFPPLTSYATPSKLAPTRT